MYPVVFPHVPLCDCVCSGSLSHMCGACAVSVWLGEEEPRDSRAQRRLRQAGSLPGRLGPRAAQGDGGPQA